MELVSEGSSEARGDAARALANLAVNNPANQEIIQKAGAIPKLVELVSEGWEFFHK